jgi:spore coat polysaccharide biosynthesis predicted glycosyltransferase SpsG
LLISDKKPIVRKSDIIIDHTYNRKNIFYKTEQSKGIKCYIGVNFFPFKKIPKKNTKKNIILINFGGAKDINLIIKSIKIIKKLGFKKKIFIISNYFSIKKVPKYCSHLNIQIIRFVKNLNHIYKQTFLSFGSCGISLYEKISFQIPSICTFVARNQLNNYRNFSKSNLIIKLDESKRLNYNELIKKVKMLKKNLRIFVKKIDHAKILNLLKNI